MICFRPLFYTSYGQLIYLHLYSCLIKAYEYREKNSLSTSHNCALEDSPQPVQSASMIVSTFVDDAAVDHYKAESNKIKECGVNEEKDEINPHWF